VVSDPIGVTTGFPGALLELLPRLELDPLGVLLASDLFKSSADGPASPHAKENSGSSIVVGRTTPSINSFRFMPRRLADVHRSRQASKSAASLMPHVDWRYGSDSNSENLAS
jgi:hypothetical protein